MILLSVAVVWPAQAAWDRYVSSSGNGPPNDEITVIAQGRRGQIAVGTAAGPAQFDGDRWQPMNASISSFVKTVLQDARGVWWIGTENLGLWQFDGTAYHRLDVPELPGTQVNVLLEDHAGDVWVGANDRLVRHRPRLGSWDVIPLQAMQLGNSAVNTMFEDHRHRLWVGTPEGASVADSNRVAWTAFRADNSPLAQDSVHAVCEDRQGGIWFGTFGGVAYRLSSDGAWQTFTAADGVPPTGNIRSIVRDSTGGMWFGTFATFGDAQAPGARLARFDGHTFRPVSGPGGSARFGEVSCLLVDDPGNLWVGTQTNGLYRYNGFGNEQFVETADPASACRNTTFSDPDAHTLELASNCLSAMLEDHTHTWWFATQEAGAARLGPDGRWSKVRAGGGLLPEDALTALLEDRSGNLWVGTVGSGVARISPTRDRSSTIGPDSGLVNSEISSLFQDAAGAMWIGTADGVSVRTGGTWRNLLQNGAPGAAGPVYVKRMLEDTTHTVWLLAGQDPPYRLWSVDPTRTQVQRHGVQDGLPSDFALSLLRSADGTVWAGCTGGIAHRVGGSWSVIAASVHGAGAATALFEDRDGQLWVGGAGVSHQTDAGWVHQSETVTLQSGAVQFLQDRSGRMWFVSPRGVAFTNGTRWDQYVQNAGLAGYLMDEIREDTQGRIWARGQGGLTSIAPDRTAPQTVFRLPPPAITTSRNVSFAFGAAYLESTDLEFAISTDGGPEFAWSPSTNFTMSNLPDGEHTFSVRARDWSHNADPTPATVTFLVDATPPQAVITAPTFRQPVRGVLTIEGRTADPRYFSHRIEVRRAGTAAWTTLDSSVRAIDQDTLLTWDTHPAGDPGRYPDGDYELRLSVQDSLGLVGPALVTVVVDNVAPFADVTSPVDIRATQGGDVFTTDTEVHIYLPPLGLDADARVTIDTVSPDSLPTTLPDGGVRVGEGWAIAWPGATLTQPGVLDMRVPSGESRALAIYEEASGSTWARVGGVAPSAGAPLSVALAAPGRYALFAGGTPVTGAALSALSLAPRAFSPQGSFGSRDVAIGFTLGRSGGVSVKVFNRAGRLLRVVADGVGMPPGAGVVRWDGRDRDGRVVQEGLYIVTVEALGERSTQTLAVLK